MKTASVIIPVYNQKNTIELVLKGFEKQSIKKDLYEVILVDDGSTDQDLNNDFLKKYDINMKLIKQKHAGRGAARNEGVKKCNNEIIIFCDGDRIPHQEFIEAHLRAHTEKGDIVVGSAYDYFGRCSEFEEIYGHIKRKSKLSPTYKKMYMLMGNSKKENAWIGYLSGNSSIDREVFKKIGGFDERFSDWGFEHMELGYRLSLINGVKFIYEPEAINFHLPHKHEDISSQLKKSYFLLGKLHPDINWEILGEFFEGKKSFEEMIDNIQRKRV